MTKSYIAIAEEILGKCNLPAATRLLEAIAGPFQKAEIISLENFILEHASSGETVAGLLEAVHAKLNTLDPDGAPKERTAYILPPYHNMIADEFAWAEKIYESAKIWNESQEKSPQSPHLRAARYVVKLILDLQILSAETVAALITSLHARRVIRMHRYLVGIPISLSAASRSQSIERMLIVSGRAASEVVDALGDADFSACLDELAAKPEQVVTTLDRQIGDTLAVDGTWTIQGLVDAACQVAIPRMPTSILGLRAGVTVSHALTLEVIERISGCNEIPRFPSTPDYPDFDDADFDDEDLVKPGEPEWKRTLRTCVKKSEVDLSGLQDLRRSDDLESKLIAGYALSLKGRRSRPATIHRYVFLIANRLMPLLEDTDPRSFEFDDWEELIEQVLDNDLFYHRRIYSTDRRERRNGYSRPLIMALRSFASYVEREKIIVQREQTTKSPVFAILPKGDMIRVEPNLITVDEYKTALAWFDGIHADHQQVFENDVCRVALILGYRCGLRISEVAFLRVCDFDTLLTNEPLEQANIHLYVRAWLLRKLKTSNARRDLPLSVLMPLDELKIVMNFVAAARRAGDSAPIFHQKRNALKVMRFDRVIELLKTAFHGDGRVPMVPDFHYHMLRHSAANIWLLKLSDSLQPVARHILRRHPRTLEWISDGQSFRVGLLGSDEIGGLDLMIISALLGHGSVAVSLRHYLHILDWWHETK